MTRKRGILERTAAWRGAKTANSQPVRPNGKI
jgi:hypothetical protein